jgi:Flp pilus assembly protein TadD
MTCPPTRRSLTTAVCLALLAAACCLAGCSGMMQSRQSYSSNQDPDRDWAAGANQPPNAKTLFAMANILASQGRDDEARFVLEKIVREHPRFNAAHVALAEVYVRKRQFDKATACLSAGLESSPGDPVLLNDLGMCYLVKDEPARAERYFQQAAAASPSEARYRGNLAMSVGLQGRYEESLALYEQVVTAADAHYNLGVICEARKDSARAAREFARAREEEAAAQKRAKSGQPAPSPTPMAIGTGTGVRATSGESPSTRPKPVPTTTTSKPARI